MNHITCFRFCYWKRIRDKDIFTLPLVYQRYRRGGSRPPALRNLGGSKLLALRGVTVGGGGVIFVKISLTYFLNSPFLCLSHIFPFF